MIREKLLIERFGIYLADITGDYKSGVWISEIEELAWDWAVNAREIAAMLKDAAAILFDSMQSLGKKGAFLKKHRL
jgi:hypothetical protein